MKSQAVPKSPTIGLIVPSDPTAISRRNLSRLMKLHNSAAWCRIDAPWVSREREASIKAFAPTPAALRCSLRCVARRASLLAHESRIESRIAWRRNYTPGGRETSKNVALTCDYGLAKLNCVSFTTAHNILRHCMTSCRNPSLCEALEHVVCLRWHTDALTLKFFAASCGSSAFRLSNIAGRN